MDDKAKIISMLNDEFRLWKNFLGGISTEQITAPNRVDRLSIKDILAHLTAWQQVSVARLKSALDASEPDYPGWLRGINPETDDELDKVNAWIDEIYGDRAWSDIQYEWQARYLRVLELAESIPEKDLLEIGKFAWLKDYPLSVVFLGSYEHHEEHLKQLVFLLQSDGNV